MIQTSGRCRGPAATPSTGRGFTKRVRKDGRQGISALIGSDSSAAMAVQSKYHLVLCSDSRPEAGYEWAFDQAARCSATRHFPEHVRASARFGLKLSPHWAHLIVGRGLASLLRLRLRLGMQRGLQ